MCAESPINNLRITYESPKIYSHRVIANRQRYTGERGNDHRKALRKMMKDLYMSKKDCKFARFLWKQLE